MTDSLLAAVAELIYRFVECLADIQLAFEDTTIEGILECLLRELIDDCILLGADDVRDANAEKDLAVVLRVFRSQKDALRACGDLCLLQYLSEVPNGQWLPITN